MITSFKIMPWWNISDHWKTITQIPWGVQAGFLLGHPAPTWSVQLPCRLAYIKDETTSKVTSPLGQTVGWCPSAHACGLPLMQLLLPSLGNPTRSPLVDVQSLPSALTPLLSVLHLFTRFQSISWSHHAKPVTQSLLLLVCRLPSSKSLTHH